MNSKYKNTGGLWINKDKNGEEYLNGSFNDGDKLIKIKIYKNPFKKDGDKSPDYRIVLDDAPRTEYKGTKKNATPKKVDTEDDIPF